MRRDEEKKLIEKKIQALRQSPSIPGPLLELVADAALMVHEAKSGVNVVVPERSALTELEKNLQGAPLLPREAFTFDAQAGRALFEALLTRTGQAGEHLKKAGDALTAAIDGGDFDPLAAMLAVIEDDEDYFLRSGEITPTAPRLAAFLAFSAVSPSLSVLAEAVHAHFPKDRHWNFGHCPVCGQAPYIARLIGKEGARHLNCSFCHLEYRAKRLMCPYCGEEDTAKLGYFTAKEMPGYAVNICETCKTYVKTVDFREFDRPSWPLLDDLESLALDLAAEKKGYRRPVLSAWGF